MAQVEVDPVELKELENMMGKASLDFEKMHSDTTGKLESLDWDDDVYRRFKDAFYPAWDKIRDFKDEMNNFQKYLMKLVLSQESYQSYNF